MTEMTEEERAALFPIILNEDFNGVLRATKADICFLLPMKIRQSRG